MKYFSFTSTDCHPPARLPLKYFLAAKMSPRNGQWTTLVFVVAIALNVLPASGVSAQDHATGSTNCSEVDGRPPAASATGIPVVGYLGGNQAVLDGFLSGMCDLGYVAERDYHLEARLTGGSAAKQSQFAAELVGMQPNLLVATGNAVIDVKKLTDTVPIVVGATPQETALQAMDSLEHPGGNVTGEVEEDAVFRQVRVLSVLKEAIPGLQRVAVITGEGTVPVQAAGTQLGLQLDIAQIATGDELEAAFDRLTARSPQALFVSGGPLMLAQLSRITKISAAQGWPSISGFRDLPAQGGLMSYGSTGVGDGPRLAARYVDEILKGAEPAELAAEVQHPQLELVINIASANQLGLTLPDSLLTQAKELIR